MVLTWTLVAVTLLAVWRGRTRHRPPNRRRRSLLAVIALIGIQLFVLSPQAFAADCTEPPIPERPGAGMVGAIDPPAGKGDVGAGTNYSKYGYAGTVWNVYDDNCVLSKSVTDPNATIDTWAGNQLFNVGKNIVGATNSLHYAMLAGGSMLAPLDNAVEQGAKTFYANVYVRWFAVVALVLAVLLFRQIWSGDLASISRRGMWALGGMWLAASVLALGPVYTQVDSLLLEKTSEIQGGFLPENSTSEDHALPESLYNNVIYKNWLRGEFGDPDSEKAKKYGPELLADQAWTKYDVTSADDEAKIKAKQDDYRSLPGKLGSSAGFFKGTDGSRVGAGFLAMFQGFAYSLFPLFAKAAVLLAQVLLRVLLLGAPLIGLAAMISASLLPKVARVAGAVLLSVLMLSALAGMHALLLKLIFAAGSELSLLAQILLAALLTVIFLMIGRPIRRMRQMVELSVGSVGTGTTSAGGGLFSKFRRRKDFDNDTPQDRFWSGVRNTDTDPQRTEGFEQNRRRARPEASGAVSATAQRLDQQNHLAAARARAGGDAYGSPGGVSGRGPTPALPPAGQARGYAGPTTALPQVGFSRIVDTPPVVEGRWEGGDDQVVVPSRVTDTGHQEGAAPAPQPRRAETEMVGGRPVFVLYRPSRGFEVRDNELWDNDRSPVR
ncbi:MAG: hypothetical protein ACRDQ5_26835 [Sciscionella sp.]